jgi:hypothetical protein
MMLQSATRSNLQSCDRLRSCVRHIGGCLPDFAGLSGYRSIPAISLNPGIDVMPSALSATLATVA